jgi:hypothetical protein
MSSFGYVDEKSASQIQNLLICIEMLLASLAHYYIFPYYEWEPGYQEKKEKQVQIRLTDTLAVGDFYRDAKQLFVRKRKVAGSSMETPDSVHGAPLATTDMDTDTDGGEMGADDGEDDIEMGNQSYQEEDEIKDTDSITNRAPREHVHQQVPAGSRPTTPPRRSRSLEHAAFGGAAAGASYGSVDELDSEVIDPNKHPSGTTNPLHNEGAANVKQKARVASGVAPSSSATFIQPIPKPPSSQTSPTSAVLANAQAADADGLGHRLNGVPVDSPALIQFDESPNNSSVNSAVESSESTITSARSTESGQMVSIPDQDDSGSGVIVSKPDSDYFVIRDENSSVASNPNSQANSNTITPAGTPSLVDVANELAGGSLSARQSPV